MPGRRADFDISGGQNETAAKDLIGRLSAPIQVPREGDFGIDFFCQLFKTGGAKSTDVNDLFALQVKGLDEKLRYGGVRDDQWRSYEIEWLRTLTVPMFLARVDRDSPRIDLYCLGGIWRVLWENDQPFEIVCETSRATADHYAGLAPSKSSAGVAHGDQQTWDVKLGPPFLSFDHRQLGQPGFVANARELLRTYIALERHNLIRFQLKVPIHASVHGWHTNSFGQGFASWTEMRWSAVPGENIRELAEAVAPPLISLGVHLQWQDNRDAYKLIDILDWLDKTGSLDELGRGLLRGLTTTRDQGKGPKPS